MRAGRPSAGAGGRHRIVRIAEACGQADQGLRPGPIVAAEGAAADLLLRRCASRHRIGVEPQRATKCRGPRAPVGGRIAGRRRFRMAGGGELRGLLAGAPRRRAVGHEGGELAAGRHGDRLATLALSPARIDSVDGIWPGGEAEQRRHGAQARTGVEGGIEGPRDGELIAAAARRRGERGLQIEDGAFGACPGCR